MTSGQKIAFSLLAALGLFVVFVLSLNSKLFKQLETRFYTQAKIEENTGQLDKISESCDSYISKILLLVEKGDNAWVKDASVRSYYVQNPSESEVTSRRRLTEELFQEIPALSGIRIVDKNGRNVHYSSFDDTDILRQNGISKIYKNYNDIIKDADEIPFENLQKLSDENKSVLLCDESHGRFILSVPFSWVDGIYSGMCLFYLNVHEVEKSLVMDEAISFTQGMTLFSDDNLNGGLAINLPYGSKKDFRNPFLTYWKNPSASPEKLLELPDGRYYVALSSRRNGNIRVSAVYTSDVFELSTEVRVLIYICVFISILLIVFLICSLFKDPMVTLQKRIKKVQLEIIQNYLDEKDKKEWGDISRQLRLRKNDLSDDIIKSLHVHSKKRRQDLSEYLDKNWDEIFTIFDSKTESAASTAVSGPAELTGASIAEIRRMLEEVLQNRPVTAAPVAVAAPVQTVVQDADEVEELAEDLDEVEEVEELAEDAEEVEEVEELAEDVDDADEVEELAEDVDDAEEVEELVEEADETDEVEELAEEVDDAEEVDELEEEVEDLAEEEVDELEEEVEDLAEEEVDELAEESDDEIEELQGVDEFDSILKMLGGAIRYEYKPSDETYFASEDFPTVDNLFGEELYIGDRDRRINTKEFPIKVYPLPEYEEIEEKASADDDFIDADIIDEPLLEEKTELPPESNEAELEEAEEEIPALDSATDFLLAGFAENISESTPELEAALAVPKAPENTIIEKDGVYSIAENLEYTNIVQDAEFKELVDSIL